VSDVINLVDIKDQISLRDTEEDILKTIEDMREGAEIREIAKSKQKNYVEVMRIAQWLSSKNLIEIKTVRDHIVKLRKEGLNFAKIGLPERRIVKEIKNFNKSIEFNTLIKKAKIPENEGKIALGWLRKKKWAELKNQDGKLIIIVNKMPSKGNDEKLLELLLEKEKLNIKDLDNELEQGLGLLKKRKEIVDIEELTKRYLIITKKGKEALSKGIRVLREISQITPNLIKTGQWKKAKFRKFDVTSPVSKIYPGKIHPINNLIREIREIFVEFGFEEIVYPLVETTFWNFDALYVPQDHPARDSWDTFYCKKPAIGNLPPDKILSRVKETHESGWKTGSKGWGYNWDISEAEKIILRTHTTAATIKFAAMNPDPPRKIFCIDRSYRNEKPDFKHLAEFMQIEGIIIDNNVSLRDLFGFLGDFYKRMGFTKIKFRPGYFPFTEPSVEADLYSPKLDKWLEMVGAGIFRPEVTKPLGIEAPVLAWGMGFERLAMLRLELEDMRLLYKNDINWLRKTPTILKGRF
jgi:phenylalanyl-tRNA synthetase alpha chain